MISTLKHYFYFFILSLCINYGSTINSESLLREYLFLNYSRTTIPVKNNSNSVDLLYGINIEGLVYFNQKAEKIKINTLTTLMWYDEYLQWDDNSSLTSIYSGDFIVIPNNLIWQPDLELYNSGSKATVFDRNSVSRLYKNGLIVYNRPTSYTFSCKLSLGNFPFDTQHCQMTFGSWKYPKSVLDLRPFSDEYELFSENLTVMLNKNMSIKNDFSHNEWIIKDIHVEHLDIEYKCCPGTLWPNSFFKISLQRNSNKYVVMIIMSVFVTLSSLIVNLLNISNYSRTYISVFIPLTLIWLQIHSSSKIPVIEESTLLERIIQLCFYTTIICAFESGIIYNIISNKYNLLNNYFNYINRDKISVPKNFKYQLIVDDESKDDNSLYKQFFYKINVFDKVFRFCLTGVFGVLFIFFLIE